MEKPLAGIFDSHAHYDDIQFSEDRLSLLERLFQSGLDGIVNVACGINQAKIVLPMAEQFEQLFFAVGFHPEDAQTLSLEQLSSLRLFLTHNKCVALGEIGLDYHWNPESRTQQIALFEAQLELAKELNLPVIIHSREACEDTMSILKEHRPNGVLHCFSYSKEVAKQAVDLGLLIGITGAITFHNARKLPEVAAYLPADRLLIETDCPYMAPVPYRGKRCDSSMLPETAKVIAEYRKEELSHLITNTAKNARTLFGIQA